MPTSQVSWEGWEFSLSESGVLRIVEQEVWVADLSLASAGWELIRTEEYPEELVTSWRRAGVTLEVCNTFYDLWTMRWSWSNDSGEPLELSTPTFSVVSPCTTQCWDGREQGWLVFDRAGDIVVGELVKGSMELIDQTDERTSVRLSANPQINLDATGSGGSLQAVWRFDTVKRLSDLAAKLPPWWPARTVLQAGEECEISLPDGSIEGEDVSQVEDGFVLESAVTGARSALVHHGRSTIKLDWYVTESLDTALTRRANELINDVTEPDTVQQFLVLKAITRQLIPLSEDAEAWLQKPTMTENGTVFGVANLTMRGQLFRDDEALLKAQRLATTPPMTFGAVFAWIGTFLAAQLRGLPLEPPPLGSPIGGAPRRLVEAEQAWLRYSVDPMRLGDLRWMVHLMGGDLPLRSLSAKSLAQAVSLARHLPENLEAHWDWARDLGSIRQAAEGKLLAANPDDETLAWLSF